MKEDQRNFIMLGVGALSLGLLIGGLIGHFATPTFEITVEDQGILDKYAFMTTDQWLEGLEAGIDQWIMNEIKTENLEKNLEYLSEKPHLATTPRDIELAEHIKEKFIDYNFDWVEMMPYDILLSFPDEEKPNRIYILDENDTAIFTSHYREVFEGQELEDDFVNAFNAFTPAGEFETEKGLGVVYVNYGTVEDFDELERLNVSVKDQIAMMRYGQNYRGNKIENAQVRGAKAAILFSDPEDVAADGVDSEDVYPNSWWIPGSGIQRGSAYLGDGDPLTPGWPSIEFAHRINESEAGMLTIPAQPIGYDDAKEILRRLGGDDAPASWQGGIEGLTYKIGPNFSQDNDQLRVKIETFNSLKRVISYNVFGTITGAVEPDRYVLIGNHRDAWGYGASDPSSGTSQLLETARVLNELMKQHNWRPRRTLVFCSWGAEEYGLIGSTEWVEEHIDKLQGRAVSYINTDTCSTGPIAELPSSPLLWDMSLEILAKVPGVTDSSKTVYDELMEFQNRYSAYDNMTKPVMNTLGSGSDYAHFFIYAGVPAMDIWFRRDQTEDDISIYPSYHTGFETFNMTKYHNDPNFAYTQGCGRVASLIIKYLADSLVLPFNLTQFSTVMQNSLKTFAENGVKDDITEFYDGYEFLEVAVANLTEETKKFHEAISGKSFDPVELRKVNDQLMKFEQTFIIPQGLPGREVTRHAVFAPSKFDNYGTSAFPGITDLMYDYHNLNETTTKLLRQEEIRKHVSLLTIMTNRAAGLLQPVNRFDYWGPQE